jgi:hypothetical protein
MVKQLLLASLGLGLLVAASKQQSTIKPFDCGTDASHASEDFLGTIQSLHSGATGGSHATRAVLSAREKDNNTAITVDAVFHIVAKEESKGDITDNMPQAQLDSLNEAYKDYGIQFNLINVTWNTNDAWASGEKDADLEMKKQLRQGTYRTLNIYFQTDLTGGVLGRCTLPSNIANGKSDPTVYSNDGCNVNANTMPDGVMDGYNRGKTAVHETGHWLGLLHTFEGYSCDGPGDYIEDTPMERESTDGCPDSPPKQSCPGQSGVKDDPIHNFMDYSIDSCYTGFTQQQHDRMHYMYNTFRDGN